MSLGLWEPVVSTLPHLNRSSVLLRQASEDETALQYNTYLHAYQPYYISHVHALGSKVLEG